MEKVTQGADMKRILNFLLNRKKTQFQRYCIRNDKLGRNKWKN